MDEIQRAHDFLTRDQDTDLPFWAQAWGPPQGTVWSRSAKAFQILGDLRNTAEHFARAAACRPATTYARIIALDLVAEAEPLLAQGSIETSLCYLVTGPGPYGRRHLRANPQGRARVIFFRP
jgi:hypothetical protein